MTNQYVEELYELIYKDSEIESELMLNKLGYFKFDIRKIDTYTTSLHIMNAFYKATKIQICCDFSYVIEALQTLIENNLHLQITKLDIKIITWDSPFMSWKNLSQFTNLKLLNIDSYTVSQSGVIPDISSYIPLSLEALFINNIPYYNIAFDKKINNSNLKVIQLYALKFNQSLDNLPQHLETLIIKSGDFNQKIDNLPHSLKHLILMCPSFNKSLDNLPHGLEYFAGLQYNCFIYPEAPYQFELINLPSSIKTLLLDINLYDKEYQKLTELYNHCKINNYTDFNNAEFIITHLIKTLTTTTI